MTFTESFRKCRVLEEHTLGVEEREKALRIGCPNLLAPQIIGVSIKSLELAEIEAECRII